MKIPKGTSQFKLNGKELEFLSKTGEKLGSRPANSINFSQQTFFSSILCTCGSEMLTISNWLSGDKEEMEEVFFSLWEQPGNFPLSFKERIKNAFNSLRGRIPGGSEVVMGKDGLLALKAIVDEAISRIDAAKESNEKP